MTDVLPVFFVPLYLQNVQGYQAIQSAALLLPLVLTPVATTTLSGFVVKHTNKTWSSFFVGFIVWTAGQGAQLCFSVDTAKAVVIVVLMVQGAGLGATLQSSELLIRYGNDKLTDEMRSILSFGPGTSIRTYRGQGGRHRCPQVSQSHKRKRSHTLLTPGAQLCSYCKRSQ